MATTFPAKLKTADIAQYVRRANQLEKYKPAIAYWCMFCYLAKIGKQADMEAGRYQALNNILNNSLQNADNDCMVFATTLMDTIEQVLQVPRLQMLNAD